MIFPTESPKKLISEAGRVLVMASGGTLSKFLLVASQNVFGLEGNKSERKSVAFIECFIFTSYFQLCCVI